MSLVPDYDSSSSSSDASDSDFETDIHLKEPQVVNVQNKLPAPSFGGSHKFPEESTKSSVFKNPYVEAENAKEAILEKHVKMVEAKDNVIIINGKKICWNYRKGRCRFGHKCKYAHDSDIQKTQEQIEVENAATINNSIVCENLPTGIKQVKTAEETSDNEERNVNIKKKRKRPGLSQGLIPGKKVMKQYLNHKT